MSCAGRGEKRMGVANCRGFRARGVSCGRIFACASTGRSEPGGAGSGADWRARRASGEGHALLAKCGHSSYSGLKTVLIRPASERRATSPRRRRRERRQPAAHRAPVVRASARWPDGRRGERRAALRSSSDGRARRARSKSGDSSRWRGSWSLPPAACRSRRDARGRRRARDREETGLAIDVQVGRRRVRPHPRRTRTDACAFTSCSSTISCGGVGRLRSARAMSEAALRRLCCNLARVTARSSKARDVIARACELPPDRLVPIAAWHASREWG